MGIFVTLVTGAFAQLHVRVNRSDDKLNNVEDKMHKIANDGDDHIWQELREHQRSNTVFRESVLTNMVTKNDLQASERRIMEALNLKRRSADAE